MVEIVYFDEMGDEPLILLSALEALAEEIMDSSVEAKDELPVLLSRLKRSARQEDHAESVVPNQRLEVSNE